jgi:hypothetical protein
MKRTLLVLALSALLIIGSGLSQSLVAVDAYAARPNVITPQGGVIYKFKAAGLQFNVPAGWEVEAENDGVTFSKMEGTDSLIMASISVFEPAAASLTLDAQLKAAWEGFNKDNDSKKVGQPDKGTQAGMPFVAQGYTSTLQGLQMVGELVLIKAAKPTLVVIYGTAKSSDKFKKDFNNLIDSMKKIE